MAYYELDSELKCDMRQVEFFIKGNLAAEEEIFDKTHIGRNNSSNIMQEEKEARETYERRKIVAPWIS